MAAHVNASGLILIAIIGAGFSLYNKYYVHAQTLMPTKPNSILYTQGDGSYEPYHYYDGNQDGFITVKERNEANTFTASSDVHLFVRNLNKKERKLLDGLTIKVAVLAYQNLTTDEKAKLLKLNKVDRINMINARFERFAI